MWGIGSRCTHFYTKIYRCSSSIVGHLYLQISHQRIQPTADVNFDPWLNLCMRNLQRADCTFIEKNNNLHVSGPM